MNEDRSNLHVAWSRLVARALVTAGVRHAVVCPGSRSTPLALAFEEEEGLDVDVIVDERSAAFFALGRAKRTGTASVVLSTSGTAPAHFFPAVIEATASETPMLVVTADRPWHAQDVHAPQTIDQTKLFGAHVRHSAELGLPDATSFEHAMRVAAQCVLATRSPAPGAVHLNARFAKPLEPQMRGDAPPETWEARVAELLARGGPRAFAPEVLASVDARRAFVDRVRSARRGVVLAGPMPPWVDAPLLRRAVERFVLASGFPLVADATSQLRHGTDGIPVLRNFAELRASESPDLVIQLGAMPSGFGVEEWLRDVGAPRVVLTSGAWHDPPGTATDVVVGDPAELLARVAGMLAPSVETSAPGPAAPSTDHGTPATSDDRGTFDGHDVCRRVFASLESGSVLLLGNGMPVRDFDAAVPPSAKSL
ncbi:MAG: 2-succinyl-5-enolpyruvyl-6-hydroxy-3-cyclohexene-1-carboxylic-acid synthase, partial [Polyangiaceae bacterium]